MLGIWLAGAFYCSGYERLLSGFDNWPGSLIWSALAVLPWFVLFEWSKSAIGRRLTARAHLLILLLIGTAALSLLFELASNAITDSHSTPLALALLRRLPAIGISLLLILWARTAAAKPQERDLSLAGRASSIDWVAAADNYVELHMGGRVLMRRLTMREAEHALAGCGFIRIHRRYLVNRQRIAGVTGNGGKTVKLAGGSELPVGSRYAANLGALG